MIHGNNQVVHHNNTKLIHPQIHGWSVLHIAAEKGFTEIYELLSDPTVCEIDTTLRDRVST